MARMEAFMYSDQYYTMKIETLDQRFPRLGLMSPTKKRFQWLTNTPIECHFSYKCFYSSKLNIVLESPDHIVLSNFSAVREQSSGAPRTILPQTRKSTVHHISNPTITTTSAQPSFSPTAMPPKHKASSKATAPEPKGNFKRLLDNILSVPFLSSQHLS